MRPIKFRGRELLTGRLVYSEFLGLPRFFKLLDDGDIELIGQFTGLHDKNGKEIYEGDIFTFTKGRRKTVAKVVFEEAMFKMKDNNGWGVMILQREDDMEVIGNIYENPELLK